MIFKYWGLQLLKMTMYVGTDLCGSESVIHAAVGDTADAAAALAGARRCGGGGGVGALTQGLPLWGFRCAVLTRPV
jgi:hypothetical protein